MTQSIVRQPPPPAFGEQTLSEHNLSFEPCNFPYASHKNQCYIENFRLSGVSLASGYLSLVLRAIHGVLFAVGIYRGQRWELLLDVS